MIVQPSLRAEVRLAERLGVSPRRLWGEEPRVRLTPDGAGGFVVEREPEFSPLDVDLFEAARVAEESLSPRGIEWADELDAKAQWQVGDEKGLPTRNFAVAAQEKARKAYQQQYPDADLSGLTWPVRLVEG